MNEKEEDLGKGRKKYLYLNLDILQIKIKPIIQGTFLKLN